ncbi:hypothetical protein NP493_141g00002 [Ridgeia piscesae]|uniref:Uncharacterized protein n=1 Tax=Ridgeia piscesae TaxID=27915 RepID=A0AAD9UG10_RIDPI|nr:hypothetical protein NP493_141g00002 [Ridgeia piscesae]
MASLCIGEPDSLHVEHGKSNGSEDWQVVGVGRQADLQARKRGNHQRKTWEDTYVHWQGFRPSFGQEGKQANQHTTSAHVYSQYITHGSLPSVPVTRYLHHTATGHGKMKLCTQFINIYITVHCSS